MQKYKGYTLQVDEFEDDLSPILKAFKKNFEQGLEDGAQLVVYHGNITALIL